MKKTALLILSLLFITGTVYGEPSKPSKAPFGYSLYDDINRPPADQPQKEREPNVNNEHKTRIPENQVTKEEEQKFYGNSDAPAWESEYVYYPDATVKSAVAKYKSGNYSGCLQEMISLTKKDPSNPLVYYYMGMAYTQVGNKDQAVKAYEAAIKLNSDLSITQYATKGRDCLVGGPACKEDSAEVVESDDPLDKFINAPYKDGFSDDLSRQIKEQQLKNIQKTINKKNNLERRDIEEIHKFDHKGEIEDGMKIASADVSNDDVLSALEVLKKAGVTVSVNPTMPQNSQYQELSMMLGTNNNNNNNNMMNMLPYLMNQNQNGQNIDPQVIQAMMMNSMIPDFTFNDKKY